MTDSHLASLTRDGSRATVRGVSACITERHSPVTFRMRSFRYLVAARLSAIWLIVLVVSPWTAPFATCPLATFSNHAFEGVTTVSSEPGTAASTEDPTAAVTPPPASRSGKLRLEHCIGEWSAILPITLAEVPLEESNRPSPPGSHSSAPAVLRL
jgi:hypothetical protein